MKLDELLKAATTRVDTVRVVRTAMNPMLWLVGIVTPLALISSVAASEPWLRVASFALGALAVVAAISAYFLLMFRDPDRLQSEEYRLRHQALRMLYRQGASAEIADAAKDIVRMDTLPPGVRPEDDS